VSAAAFVVAGGRSRRMGCDKALLPWGETDLLGHALARLRAVAHDVRILCGPGRRYFDRGVPVETDLVPDAGPLAGVLAGLAAATGRPGLFLAVDLPRVSVALLARLLALAEQADAVVPLSSRGPEPLCAVYGPRCLEPIRRCVAAGELKMTSFWPGLRVREVRPEELAPFGDPDDLFRNLNTPADLEEDPPRPEPDEPVSGR
jgi:molybdopterin-guanine dinucleotide biosynthesis protein A